MAKSKNNLFGKTPKIPLGETTRTSITPTMSVPRDGSSNAVSISSSPKVTPLSFGAFHSKSTAAEQSSPWTSLLEKAASGGIASALGGDLSVITGLGGLFSSILGLFQGSKSAPAAPVQFVLPQSRQSTVTLQQQSSTQTNLSSGTTIGSDPPTFAYQSGSSTRASGSSNAAAATASPAYQPSVSTSSHTQVVQIVKQALLTSSSLNDVISEI